MTASIDWVARWRELVEVRHDQGRRLDDQHRRADAWAGRAARFASHVAEGGSEDPLLRRLLSLADHDTTVLDVGAGPGRHSVPLARVARSVTAVEPSAAMREQLLAVTTREGLTNVTIVPAEWPIATDSSLSTHHSSLAADLVICSHVLYPVAEVDLFLRALDSAARRGCYLTLRLGQREEPYLALFEQVWGEPRAFAPTVLDLFNVAHQLGFRANFEVVPFPAWRTFADFEDAVAQARADILNPDDPRADGLIRSFMRERLSERDGTLGLLADAPRAGVVWWERTAA